MASNLKYSAVLKNNQQGAIVTTVSTSGLINVMGGPQRTNPDTALANTTLSATITTSQTTIVLVSATGFPSSGSYTLWVGAEQMTVTGGQGTATLTVTRGVNGSTALASASGTAITNTPVLATLTCSATLAPAASAGVLTLNTITSGTGTTAAGAGTAATWYTITTSGGTPHVDGTCGVTSGFDMNFVGSATIATGQQVGDSSFTLTNGN